MVKLVVSSVRSFLGQAFSQISKLWTRLQPQRWVSIAFVGLLLLTTSVDSADLNQSTKDALNNLIAKGENGRPVTTRQWQAENEALQGQPGKQAERIGKEAADAVDEMGEIYPGNVKTLTPGLENESLEKDD